jgi:hypothetical protein
MPVFCHRCGTQGDDTARFCKQCGTALVRESAAVPAEEPTAAVIPSETTAPAPTKLTTERTPVSKETIPVQPAPSTPAAPIWQAPSEPASAPPDQKPAPPPVPVYPNLQRPPASSAPPSYKTPSALPGIPAQGSSSRNGIKYALIGGAFGLAWGVFSIIINYLIEVFTFDSSVRFEHPGLVPQLFACVFLMVICSVAGACAGKVERAGMTVFLTSLAGIAVSSVYLWFERMFDFFTRDRLSEGWMTILIVDTLRFGLFIVPVLIVVSFLALAIYQKRTFRVQ